MDFAIEILIVALMVGLGANLTSVDLAELKHRPRPLLAAAVAQWLLLPLVAWILIGLLAPEPAVAIGLLLVSFSPGGALSNLYSLLARANAALSVALTTVTSIGAIVALPLLLALLLPQYQQQQDTISALTQHQIGQLFQLLIMPIMAGHLIRRWFPVQTQKHLAKFERLSSLALLILIISIFFQFQLQLSAQFHSLVILAIPFTIIALFIGWIVGNITSCSERDHAAIIIEFPVRNLAFTSLLALTLFNDSQYLLFAAVFFTLQTPLMLILTLWYRHRQQGAAIAECG
ncbi:bile acid:sodium symporter family protein [Ferrimonas sp. SCSIO 43195]|uniref:bile acid:sodium symporter family protein n=1 Tax=Ferrimonas sp. SCSIO 43195 TaxID=2822844 RepID=UPI0020751A56|nr:bile acid:sodium symporter [Ferrimonas sp. SCSIO 43195]USD39481.1 bile acid:sodium symporter [Ferrimonas sp. SCSIO 43195]